MPFVNVSVTCAHIMQYYLHTGMARQTIKVVHLLRLWFAYHAISFAMFVNYLYILPFSS